MTHIELSKQLPHDIREKYLYNFELHWRAYQMDVPLLPFTIKNSFLWSETPEGHQFWDDINKKHINGEYSNKPIKSIKKHRFV